MTVSHIRTHESPPQLSGPTIHVKGMSLITHSHLSSTKCKFVLLQSRHLVESSNLQTELASKNCIEPLENITLTKMSHNLPILPILFAKMHFISKWTVAKNTKIVCEL